MATISKLDAAVRNAFDAYADAEATERRMVRDLDVPLLFVERASARRREAAEAYHAALEAYYTAASVVLSADDVRDTIPSMHAAVAVAS